MSTFFSRERFGQPQMVAALFLLVFLAQGLWLSRRAASTFAADPEQGNRLQQGLRQWRRIGIGEVGPEAAAGDDASILDRSNFSGGYDPNHSALYYLIASFPLLAWRGSLQPENVEYWGWLARVPALLFGLLLGGSLWYVSHRLYGNAGGYVALALYSFSPGMIRASAGWFAQPEMGAAWGAFGGIFTAIAVAHTLYAPREVILWNWRRMVLLGLALALAVGSQFSLIVLLPTALGFMVYLAPMRRGAAIAIWAAACALSFILLFAGYFFRPADFWEGMRQARFAGFAWQSLGMPVNYRSLLTQVGEICPALALAGPAALITYAAWPRARYFGNTAPLLVVVLFLLLGLASPHYVGLGFRLLAVPFLFLFVAGVFSDLLETRRRALVLASLWGLLSAYGVWSVLALARL
jgi:hypothetical protein